MPVINKPNQHFDVSLYTGNGTAQSITNSGGFQPDLVWFKLRSGTSSTSNILQDVIRGATKVLVSNSTAGNQNISTYLTAFNSNGFSVGNGSGADINDVNTNSYTYVGWQWKASNASAVTNNDGTLTSQVSANPTAGFSIVTWTSAVSHPKTIGHGLGAVPKLIFVKNIQRSVNWAIYHTSIGNTKALYFDSGNPNTDSGFWNDTTPSSTVFTTGNGVGYSTGGIAENYVAYCWSEVAGYSAFGSYTGNGSTDGPFIYTGFRPKLLIIKNITSGTNDWAMVDGVRETYNVGIKGLKPNKSEAEYSGYNYRDLLSNGFKLRNGDSDTNSNGSTYIYAAFAEAPFKYANAR